MATSNIHVVGDIDHAAYCDFSRKLAKLESDSQHQAKASTVRIHLMSDGGDANVALAFYDRIIKSPCPIEVVATGLVASAAVLILAAGEKRMMTENAWIMVHEDHLQFEADKDVSVSELEKDAAHYRRMETQWCKLMTRESTTIFEYWTELHKRTTYLDAQECLDLGIIEEII